MKKLIIILALCSGCGVKPENQPGIRPNQAPEKCTQIDYDITDEDYNLCGSTKTFLYNCGAIKGYGLNCFYLEPAKKGCNEGGIICVD